MRRKESTARAQSTGRGAEAFVLVAITLVAVAVGCRAYFQLGAGLAVSLGLMGVTYLVLAGLHALRNRGQRKPGQAAAVATGGHAGSGSPADSRAPEAPVQPVAAKTTPAAAGPAPQPAAPPTPAARPSASLPQPPRAAPAEFSDDDLGHAAIKEFWTYRPSDPVLEPGPQLSMPPPITAAATRKEPAAVPLHTTELRRPEPARFAAAAPRLEPAAVPQTPPPSALREADVEMIQSLIKKLADEVNASDAVAASLTSGMAPPPLPAAAPQPGHSLGLTRPVRQIEDSLDALRVTASAMREASARSAPPALAELRMPPIAAERATAPQPTPHPAPPPVSQGHLYVAAIAEAVHSGRFDVLLEPIMGLGDLRACHYEVSIQLLDPAGDAIGGEASDAALAGTTLLPLLDRTRLERTASVARRLAERGKPGSVFSDFSGEALIDEGFLTGAADSCRGHAAFSGQLVLTFAQNDLRMATEAQLRCLLDLRAMGFRFALAGVTDLDMDFEHLVATGFAFVKLDADVFLEGLASPHGTIPARDVCGYLARMGLTLVVDRIDTEGERSRLHGFGVMLGQGGLFGGPRPMKADALAGARHAAA